MFVRKATCGKCDKLLADDMLKLYGVNQLQISKYSDDHGKIKSSLFCGLDMSCNV